MKVALVYNLKKKHQLEAGLPMDYYSEFDSIETVEAIGNAIKSLGYDISFAEADNQIINKLIEQQPDIVFNIAEGFSSPNRESQIPAMLDYLGIPYTGSGVLALAVALDKGLAKKLFIQNGITTPKFQLFEDTTAPLNNDLKFPLIVKPNSEGSGKGITKNSVVYDKERLYQEISRIIASYNQEALVEEFIDGKELTVGVLGNGKFLDLPVLEIDFSECKKSGEYFYSWRMKEYQGNVELGLTPGFYCPARLDDETTKKVKDIAYQAHRVLGLRDISRVDIKLGEDGVPYVLEANPLPGLDPKESNLPLMTTSAGISYNGLIGTILSLAVSRYNFKERVKPKSFSSGTTITYLDSIGNSISKKQGGREDVI